MPVENFNAQVVMDIRHLAQAVKLFKSAGNFSALKSTSTLVRSIVEDWIEQMGGCEIDNINDALEMLDTVGLVPQRKPRDKQTKTQKENAIQEALTTGGKGIKLKEAIIEGTVADIWADFKAKREAQKNAE